MKQALRTIYAIILAALLVACEVATPIPLAVATVTAIPSLIVLSPTAIVLAATPTVLPTDTARSFSLENVVGRGTPQYSPDGKSLILPTSSGIFVLDTTSYQNGRLLISSPEHSYDHVSVSPDGKLFASGNQLITVNDDYDVPNLQIPSSIGSNDYWDALSESRFSPDNTLLAVRYGDRQIDIWDLLDRKLLYSLSAESMDFSPNGNFIAAVTRKDGTPRIQLYEAQTGSLLKDWSGERAVFLPDNRLALEDYGAIRIYDPSTGKVPNVFNGKFSAFSPDGKLIALLYYNRVEVHQVTDGKLLHKLPGNFVNVDDFNLRFAPDGQSLVADAYWSYCCAGYSGSLSLWRVADGVLLREFPLVTRFNFSPDSKSLAVFNYGLQIWNTADGSVRVDLKEITVP